MAWRSTIHVLGSLSLPSLNTLLNPYICGAEIPGYPRVIFTDKACTLLQTSGLTSAVSISSCGQFDLHVAKQFLSIYRKVVKPPTTGQLTIFYAGSVNVYDDVSWDKAQAVMLKASEGCKASADAVHSIADAPPLPLTKASMSNHLTFAHASNSVKNHVMSSCPVLPSALSLSTLKRNQPGSGSTDTDDQAGAKRIGAMVSTFEDEQSRAMSTSMVATTAAKIFPRAVPQARKASLARFLEKRKERVSNAMPYSFDKNSSENSAVPNVTAASSNCSVPQNYRTNNQNFSLVKGQAKNCDDNSDSPSTNLEM